MKEAMFSEKLENKKVRCFLCAHQCVIKDGKRGICHVRENRNGTLYSLVYGKLISMNIDPIEKKPLFHFMPGSTSLSIATVGCNFRCHHCQNYDISEYPRKHPDIPGQSATPEDVVNAAENTGAGAFHIRIRNPLFFSNLHMTVQNAHRAKGSKTFLSVTVTRVRRQQER